MKTVVNGESSGARREEITAVYPRYKNVADKFIAQGVVVGIGPFAEAAEAFIREDPFILEGLVKSYVIKDWNDSLLPE